MKKGLIKTIILVAVLLVLSFLIYKIFFTKKYHSYVTISYDKFIEKINSNDTFVLFIGSDECSHCTTYKVTLNEIIKKYNIEVDYLNVQILSEEEYAYLNSHFPFSGTPTTMIISNGEKQKVMVGAKGYDYTVEFFKKNNIIKG